MLSVEMSKKKLFQLIINMYNASLILFSRMGDLYFKNHAPKEKQPPSHPQTIINSVQYILKCLISVKGTIYRKLKVRNMYSTFKATEVWKDTT